MKALLDDDRVSLYDLIAIHEPCGKSSFLLPRFPDRVNEQFDRIWAGTGPRNEPNICIYVRKFLNWDLVICTKNVVSTYFVGAVADYPSQRVAYFVHNVYDAPPSANGYPESTLRKAFDRANEMCFEVKHHFVLGSFHPCALACDGQCSNPKFPGIRHTLDERGCTCVTPKELVLRQLELLLKHDGLSGTPTYAAYAASRSLQDRINSISEIGPSDATHFGPVEVSLDISLLRRPLAMRQLRWEDLNQKRLTKLVTAHLETFIRDNPPRLRDPRLGQFSASSIQGLTDRVVNAIHMSIEASAPWYHFQAVKWAHVRSCRGPLGHGRSQQRPSTLTQDSVAKMAAAPLLSRNRPYPTVSNPANIKRRRTFHLSATNPKNRQPKYHIQKSLLPAYPLRKSHPGHVVWELLDQLPRHPIDKKEILRAIRGRVAHDTEGCFGVNIRRCHTSSRGPL